MSQLITDLVSENSTPYALHLTIVGESVELRTNSGDTLQFVRDTFLPQGVGGVEITEAGALRPSRKLVDLAVQAQELVKLKEQLARQPWTAGTYSPTADSTLACWRGPIGRAFQLSADSESPVLVATQSSWIVIGTPRREQRRDMVRVIRYAANRLLEDAGYVAMHASAASNGPHGVLFVGDSGSGKSTFSLALAKFVPYSSWLSNDRVYVRLAANNELEMLGFPLPAALNFGSLVALGLDTSYHAWMTHDEMPTDASDWREYDGERKLKLSPGEVHRLMRLELAAIAPVSAVVYPQIIPGAPSAKLGVLDGATQLPTLTRNCLSIKDNLYADDWLDIGKTSREDLLTRSRLVLDRLAGMPSLAMRAGQPSDTAPLVERLASELAVLRA